MALSTCEVILDALSSPAASVSPLFAKLVAGLRARQSVALRGGGDALVARHHARGKMLVRDRVDLLLDLGSPFLELSPLAAWGLYAGEVPAAGIVTGIGLVHETPCMIIANDATVKGGSFFAETVRKHLRAQEIAEENRLPCLLSGRLRGRLPSRTGPGLPGSGPFRRHLLPPVPYVGGRNPALSAVFGGCTAGGAYIPALSDEVVMVRGSARIHLGGPSIVKAAIKEIVDGETLGGADMHTAISGVSDHVAADEREAWPPCDPWWRHAAHCAACRHRRSNPCRLPAIRTSS